MPKLQLLQEIGDVELLTTTSKEIVGAIDELKETHLPLTGGNMTGDIFIQNEGYPSVWLEKGSNNGIGKVEGNNNSVSLQSYNVKGDGDNRRVLRLDNSASMSDLANSLRLVDFANGYGTYYRVFGEHNRPTEHTLSTLGFSGNEFSETDLEGNIALILQKLKIGQSLTHYINRSGEFANLITSISGFLGIGGDFTINIPCFGGTNNPNIINIMLNNTPSIYQFSYDDVLRFRGDICQFIAYTNLTQLNVSEICTPSELAKAMPNYSTLNMNVFQDSHQGLDLPQSMGILEVKKTTANYCSFTFKTCATSTSVPTLYTGHYHAGIDVWTGWQPLATTVSTQQTSDLERQVADLEIQLLMSN